MFILFSRTWEMSDLCYKEVPVLGEGLGLFESVSSFFFFLFYIILVQIHPKLFIHFMENENYITGSQFVLRLIYYALFMILH